MLDLGGVIVLRKLERRQSVINIMKLMEESMKLMDEEEKRMEKLFRSMR